MQISNPVELLQRFKERNLVAADSLEYAFTQWAGENHVLKYSGLTVADMARRVERFRECAEVVELREYNGIRKVHAANYCSNPSICPVCSRRVASRRRGMWFGPISEAAKIWPCVYLVTFTVKSGDSLRERYDTLKGSIRRFRRMGQRRQGDSFSNGEWSKVRAAIISDEVIRGKKSGKWHVHSHGILFCEEPIDFRVYKTENDRIEKRPRFTVEYDGKMIPASKISDEWYRATNGNGVNIHLSKMEHCPNRTGKKAWSREKRGELAALPFAESIAFQCTEVLKYATKISTLRGQDTIQVIDALYNRRTITGNAKFFNLPRYQCPSCGRCASALVLGNSSICPDCGTPMNRDNSTEYRESSAMKADGIFEIRWNRQGGHYSEAVSVDHSIFQDLDCLDYEDVKKRYQRASAIMIGAYRTKRRKLLNELGDDRGKIAAGRLDGLHDVLRDSLRKLWDQYIVLVKELYPFVKGECPAGRFLPPSWSATERLFGLVCWDCSAEFSNLQAGDSRTCPDCGGTLVHRFLHLPAESTA